MDRRIMDVLGEYGHLSARDVASVLSARGASVDRSSVNSRLYGALRRQVTQNEAGLWSSGTGARRNPLTAEEPGRPPVSPFRVQFWPARLDRLRVTLGTTRILILADFSLSPHDPYITTDSVDGTELLISVNAQHPAFAASESEEAVRALVIQCVYDGVVEHLSRFMRGSSAFVHTKDALLRCRVQIGDGDHPEAGMPFYDFLSSKLPSSAQSKS